MLPRPPQSQSTYKFLSRRYVTVLRERGSFSKRQWLSSNKRPINQLLASSSGQASAPKLSFYVLRSHCCCCRRRRRSSKLLQFESTQRGRRPEVRRALSAVATSRQLEGGMYIAAASDFWAARAKLLLNGAVPLPPPPPLSPSLSSMRRRLFCSFAGLAAPACDRAGPGRAEATESVRRRSRADLHPQHVRRGSVCIINLMGRCLRAGAGCSWAPMKNEKAFRAPSPRPSSASSCYHDRRRCRRRGRSRSAGGIVTDVVY